MLNIYTITSLSILHFAKISTTETSVKDSFCQFAKEIDLICLRYNITTEDGYILGLYNIPGDRQKPVYLQHGFVDSSDTFMIRGKSSLVVHLAKKGYDLWLGNMRGNKHSREHLWLDPNSAKFWEFSFHEIGIYDIPTIIDFILNKTGEKQIQVIAHSLGTTSFLVMGALKPDYNERVNLLISLAPIAYLNNAESPLMRLISLNHNSSRSMKNYTNGEFLRNSTDMITLARVACMNKLIGYSSCFRSFFDDIFGREQKDLGDVIWPIGLRYFPCGSSLMNGLHLLQLAARKKFAQYDYGSSQNMVKYNSEEPPKYNLSMVYMKTILMIGSSDKFSNAADVQLLRKRLPNVLDYHVMPLKRWRHFDFVWGKDEYMKEYLFGYLENTLNKYFRIALDYFKFD